MLALENADEILQILDRFTKQKSKDIPPELEDYISYVAKTGDTVYRWPTVQYLFREKLRNVIKDFHDTTASIEDLPQCPNVDQFNYESMKTLLFERFDNFQAAPFTVQRLCELLTDPKKHYSRLDKFMRALEKNILVVSTVDPGRKPLENDDSDHLQANGDISADIISEIELIKNDTKLSTNGTTEKKQNDIKAEESIDKAEIASSSGISSTVTTDEDKAKETEVVDTKVESDDAAVEKPAQSATVTSEAEPQTSNDEEMAEAPKPSVDKTVETKPIEQKAAAEDKPEEIDTTTPEKTELKEIPEKVDDEKTDNMQIDSKPEVESEVTSESAKEVVPTEEKSADEGVKEAVPVAEEVKNTPPTPKRAASACDDEENGGDEDGDSSKNPCAKKIKLDLEPTEIKNAEIESTPIADVELKEADILDSISTEIDAQKESELLEEVDTALAADKDSIDVKPIAEDVVLDAEAVLKSVENTPATDLLKTDEPVAADLDFTPDEALNELVSSDILAAVIPEQPAIPEVKETKDEPVKITTEPTKTAAPEQASTPAETVVPAVVVAEADAAVINTTTTAAPATDVVAKTDATATVAADAAAVVDEMNVENTEAASNAEAENAMEEAPIKADEEKMDVDESNSTDAMDL